MNLRKPRFTVLEGGGAAEAYVLCAELLRDVPGRVQINENGSEEVVYDQEWLCVAEEAWIRTVTKVIRILLAEYADDDKYGPAYPEDRSDAALAQSIAANDFWVETSTGLPEIHYGEDHGVILGSRFP